VTFRLEVLLKNGERRAVLDTANNKADGHWRRYG
jgi:hypothetical protein